MSERLYCNHLVNDGFDVLPGGTLQLVFEEEGGSQRGGIDSDTFHGSVPGVLL